MPMYMDQLKIIIVDKEIEQRINCVHTSFTKQIVT